MGANEKQVGGEHYRTKRGGVQHWDYAVYVNLPYLESAASKYLTRCGKKDEAVKEVGKALHYMEKRAECLRNHVGILKSVSRNQGLFNRFIEDNNIPHYRREVIDLVMHWRSPEQLEEAIVKIRDLLDDLQAGATEHYVNQG